MKDRIARNPGVYRGMIPADNMEAVQNGEEFEIVLARNDDPEEEGTPYNKESVLPDDVAEAICPNIEDPTPADAFRELSINSMIHYSDINNPHNVNYEQVGAVSVAEYEVYKNDTLNHITSVEGALNEHIANTENPHGVTCEQIGAATKEDLGNAWYRNALIVTGEHWNEEPVVNSSVEQIYWLKTTEGIDVFYEYEENLYPCVKCSETEAIFEITRPVVENEASILKRKYFVINTLQDCYFTEDLPVDTREIIKSYVDEYLLGGAW